MESKLSNNSKIGNIARLTGGSIVLMAVVAMVTVGFFHETLFPQIVTEEVVQKHTGSGALLVAIIGWGIICVLDFIVSWGVYVLLKDKNRTMALISGGLRLVYTLFLCVAISKLVILLGEANKETMSMTDMAAFIERTGSQFYFIWQLGLILFGMHLVMTGIALFKRFPKMKILFILLIIGGIGYCLTSGLVILNLSNTSVYNVINSIMLLPMIVGELGLGIWLLVKGHAAFNAA
jgi:hypothetical protein